MEYPIRRFGRQLAIWRIVLRERGVGVERLSPSDLDRVLRFVREIAVVERPSDFPSRVLDGLKRLIPCDMIGYNEINRARGQTLMVLNPTSLDASGVEGQVAFERLAGQHPVLRYHTRSGDGRALKISDFLSRDEFHRLDLYAESFRLIGAEDQLAVALPSPAPFVIGLALNRSRRSFSERDRQVLDLVRPHLAYAHHNAELRAQLSEMVVLLERLADTKDRAIVLIDQSRTVRKISSGALGLFAAHLGFRIAPGSSLPKVIEAWITRHGRPDNLEDPHAPAGPLVVEGEHGRLVVHFVPRGEIGEYDALLLEQVRDQAKIGPLGRLSSREHEVLHWVARGKTNPQIAGILSLSTGTVQKHLEHIYDKLGVRTRAGAAAVLAGGRNVAEDDGL
jgi:DNA-binding CsgD family transcriptional regulator/GAF domain-containing protein